MNTTATGFLLLIFFTYVCENPSNNSRVGATELSEEIDDAAFTNVLSLLYNYRLARADTVIDSLIGVNPKLLKARFFKVLLYWWYYEGDIHGTRWKERFLAAVDDAIELGEEEADATGATYETSFYLGATYGYLARFHLNSSALKAVYYGKKAKSIFSDLVEENPDLYDAYYGIGLYNYSAATVPSALEIVMSLLGISGDRNLGMQQLHLAAMQGTWTRVEVLFVLSQLHFYYENNYNEAMRVLVPLVNQFPSNPVFKKYLALSYFKSGRYSDAIAVYEALFTDSTIEYVNSNQIAECYAELAVSYFFMNDFPHAVKYLGKWESTGTREFRSTTPWYYYYFGMSEEKLGNTLEALRHYHGVLQCKDKLGLHSQAEKAIQRLSMHKP